MDTIAATAMTNNLELIEQYTETRECDYKGEHYSVRDNGAVMRHPKNGRIRANDNHWTFGNIDKAGYPAIAGARVHCIVAVAFLPPPERDDFVIDHIDTNRQNNRPANLHWVSRLDNIVLNPITRSKIEYLTGMKIEDVLKDMSVLRDAGLPSYFSWMCAVSQEEADKSLKMWLEWADNPNKATRRPSEKSTKERVERFLQKNSQEWQNQKAVPSYVIKAPNYNQEPIRFSSPTSDSYPEQEIETPIKVSRTPGVLLWDWSPDGDFPLCPGPGRTLEDYLSNIQKDAIIYHNDFNREISVQDAGISEDGTALMVKGYANIGAKQSVVIRIFLKDGLFAHKRYPFFDGVGQDKYYTLGLGKEWTGGDCFDDYCMHVSPDWLTTNE